ncbi:MAG TPA: hypothetical protein VJ777_27780, partial [Mycobacterium sp.]|nr:hypothetical protein [Mycobacterium sp.]
CEYDDVLGDWAALREIDDRGALLIRPDRHIAWRSHTRPDNPEDTLRAALRQALALTDPTTEHIDKPASNSALQVVAHAD